MLRTASASLAWGLLALRSVLSPLAVITWKGLARKLSGCGQTWAVAWPPTDDGKQERERESERARERESERARERESERARERESERAREGERERGREGERERGREGERERGREGERERGREGERERGRERERERAREGESERAREGERERGREGESERARERERERGREGERERGREGGREGERERGREGERERGREGERERGREGERERGREGEKKKRASRHFPTISSTNPQLPCSLPPQAIAWAWLKPTLSTGSTRPTVSTWPGKIKIQRKCTQRRHVQIATIKPFCKLSVRLCIYDKSLAVPTKSGLVFWELKNCVVGMGLFAAWTQPSCSALQMLHPVPMVANPQVCLSNTSACHYV